MKTEKKNENYNYSIKNDDGEIENQLEMITEQAKTYISN